MILKHVPAADLRQYWPWVRRGLEGTTAKTGSRHLPEDVYADIKNGVSHLYLIGYSGYVIFQQRKDLDGTCLHVFTLWCPGAGEFKQELLSAIDDLGRSVGAIRVTAQGRKGWGKVGFREVSRNFEREV